MTSRIKCWQSALDLNNPTTGSLLPCREASVKVHRSHDLMALLETDRRLLVDGRIRGGGRYRRAGSPGSIACMQLQAQSRTQAGSCCRVRRAVAGSLGRGRICLIRPALVITGAPGRRGAHAPLSLEQVATPGAPRSPSSVTSPHSPSPSLPFLALRVGVVY